MAVYRVERTKDYTVMSNYHLKDTGLTLKSKGLLSMMLSLPDEWNYSTRGLASICKEGVDAIGKALKELERAGYIVRHQLRGANGRITDTEYIIYEQPQTADSEDGPGPGSPDTDLPDTENPDMVNPDMAAPDVEPPDTENRPELNIKQSKTKKSNTKRSNTQSFLPSEPDGLTDGWEEREEIRTQIDYDSFVTSANRQELDELVEIMLEVSLNRSPTIRIGREAEYPTAYVQDRFRQITAEHIEKVLDGIKENTTRVWNTKAYLMAALFNSVSTTVTHFTMLVNHDLYGDDPSGDRT